jgi:cytidyltransferase-like protein
MLDSTAKIVLISGGFDPLHSGHVRLITEAAKMGRLYVALNSNRWLKKKKGYVFMPWEERAEILRAMRGVVEVLAVDDADGTVCLILERVRPAIFANGGDRVKANANEHAVCAKLGILEIFEVGGYKINSSSALVAKIL